MKKFLSVLITIMMLMQMFTFAVSSEEAQLVAYWTGEGPGEIVFTTVEGMKKYELKLYKDGKLVEETSHSIGGYVFTELRHNFLNKIIENGKGIYTAEVIYEDGVTVKTGNYRYIAPSNSLQKPDYIEFNQEKNYIVWGEVADAVLYEVKFVFSVDGGNSFFDMNSYQLDAEEDGTFFDFWGNPADELTWIEDCYQEAIMHHEATADSFVRAVQVVAYPYDFNKANPSYSDYVTFDGIMIPDSGDEPAEDGSYSYMEIVDYQNEYEIGQDFYAQLRLYIVTEDGTEINKVVNSKDCVVEGFDPFMPGWQEVTIWYGELSTVCDVFVRGADEPEPVYAVSFENVKAKYEYGEEFYAEAWMTDSNGEYYQVEGWWVEGFDPYMSGWQTVILCYGDYSEIYKVYVAEKEQDGYLKVSMDNVEFFPGDEFYAEVYVYEADGVCYQVEDYEYVGFDSYTPGEQVVTIIYGNLSTTVKVWVYEEETEPDVIESVYWTGECPAQIYFTFVPGVMTYSIKVLKDNKEIYSDTRDFKRYDKDEGGKFSLRDVVLENGEGVYTVGVAPVFDGFMDTGKYTVSERLIYREPADALPAVRGVTYNLDTYEITWNPIEEAAEYDVVFCYSPDGGENFYPVTAYGAEEDGYFNFYGDADYEIEWLKDEYESYAAAEGMVVEDLVMAIQIKAFPLNLNDAAPSASKYVIFWETEPVPGIRDVRVERLKKQYYEGEEIEAEIWYETEEGRHEFTEDFEVEGYDAYFIGEQNVTISFGGYSEDFTVTVKPRPIIDENVTHIRIENLKTLYYVGEEFEAEVYAYRDDGSCYMVEDYLYYDFDSSIADEQQVTVRYGDFTDNCVVCVYESELTGNLSGSCGNNLTWVLDTNGVLTISGAGEMTNYENTNGMPWYYNRGRIKEIIIEKGVTSIGKNAFAWSRSLKNVVIPDTVTQINDYAFYACENLQNIIIPDSVKTIGSFAFCQCTRMENVILGEGITLIEEYAFAHCNSLTNVNIHSGIKLENCVFRYCERLENINIDESNPYYCSIDGNLFNKDKTILIQYAIGKRDTHYEIPYGVITIEEAAFDSCKNLTSVTIPDSVTAIGDYAFRGSGLTNLVIPDSVKTIAQYSFTGCQNLTRLVFGNGITKIPDYAFSSCRSLTDIIFSDSITEIGNNAFWACSALTNLTIGNNITKIGEYAFWSCGNLTTVTIPKSVTSIQRGAFWTCDSLTDVYYEGTATEWNKINIGSTNNNLLNATIHFNSKPDPEPAYSVTFENVKTEYEFGEEFYIEVYQYTTEGIKVALTGWEVEGFDSTVAGQQRVTVKYGDYSETFVVYVSEKTEGDSWWEYIPDTRELIIREEMGNYGFDLNAGYTEAPWAHLAQEVEIISIWDGVTSITSGVFINFTNLKEVNLGGTVSRIAPSAFDGCTALEHITIPDSVVNIGTRAFANCGLRTIDLGKGIRVIGPTAFLNCKFEIVYLPESLSAIRTGTFAGCRYLKEIHIPASVMKIESGAFNGCIALTDVYFGGTEEEWNNFEIANGSGPVLNVTIHYNNEEKPTEYVSFENVKTEYEYGEKFYAEVWITDAEGNRWQADNYEIFGFDPYMSGWQTVTLRYGYYEESFEVFVSEKEEEPYIVSVDFELLRNHYYLDEELEVRVYVHTSDGECNEVYDYEIEGFGLGERIITIRYGEFSQEFPVRVVLRPSVGGGGGGGSDGTGPVIAISEAKCRVGNTVDVEVSISENTGFMNLGLEIEYDRALKLVGVKDHNTGATFTGAQNLDVYPYNFNFSSTGDVAYNGTLVTLTFEIPEDTQPGDYFVGVDFYKGRNGDYIDGVSVNFNADENPLNLCYEDGYVNVYNYIPGDINGNGVVDNKDGTALLRYLAGWEMTDIDTNAIDVDGNGTVDNKDGTRLLKYLAGWDVEVH